MTPDPCKSIDPAALDILDLTVWLPGDSFDTIDQCKSSELDTWKTSGVGKNSFAPKFAIFLVHNDHGLFFQMFGVN